MAGVRALLRSAGLHVACVRCFHPSPTVNKLVQFNLSDIGEGIKEVTVKNWFVKENDEVNQFDNICEVESDKATVSITSRFDGRVAKLYYDVGDVALVGKPLVDIDVPNEDGDSVSGSGENSEKSSEPPLPEVKEESSTSTESERLPESFPTPQQVSEEPAYSEANWNKSLATPAVRRIAMENNIKLSEVKGTGKSGRVMKEDILAYLESKKGSKEDTQKITRVPLTNIQKAMTRTMTESLKIPQFGFHDQFDVSNLVIVRKEVKEFADKKGVRLTFVPFFIKAISKGLLEYPILNSSFDVEREEIVYNSSHNIGVAVDSPNGLIVPNVKNVQNLSVVGIAKELERLRDLAIKMKLPPTDLAGGTFTVSNIGNISGTGASPVILPPQVAILGICQIQRLPRFDSAGNVVPADILSISWSADHRIIDGATVARCTEVFRYYLENPSALLLDL